MKPRLIYYLAILVICGCASDSIKTKEELANLRFVDANTFDQNLYESMVANTETINIAMIGKVSVNIIPERLGKWLSVITTKQGKVDFKSTTPPKPASERTTGSIAVTAIIGILPTAYDFFKGEISYGPAVNYNAVLYYQADTGLLEKVVFIKK